MSAFAAMCLLCLGITLTAWGAIGILGVYMRIRNAAPPSATNQATHIVCEDTDDQAIKRIRKELGYKE